jgi:hypothetical protein
VAQEAALKYPEANSAVIPSDVQALVSIIPGLGAAGALPRLTSIAGEGSQATQAFIAAGKLTANLAFSNLWAGWALADTLNSAFAGKPTRDSGMGWQLVDKQHPAKFDVNGYVPSIDFQSAYKKLWGK